MDRLIYTSLSSTASHELQRIRLHHDLANLSTVGYKQSGSSTFEAAFVNGPGFPSRYQPVMSANGNTVDLSPGVRMETGNALDIAMDGQTVLGVQTLEGEIAYTRRGDLRVTPDGLLETGDGHLVMGEVGPITVPSGSAVTLTPDGSVFVNLPGADNQASQLVGQLLLRDATGQRLERRVDGLFDAVDEEGVRVDDFGDPFAPVSVTVGSLEGSNVNPIEVMVNLLDMYRSFETQMKIIQNADQADQDGNKLMGMR